jgi:hypothetical protein
MAREDFNTFFSQLKFQILHNFVSVFAVTRYELYFSYTKVFYDFHKRVHISYIVY